MKTQYRSRDPLFIRDLNRIRSYFSYANRTNNESPKIMRDAKSKGLFSRLYFAYYEKWKAENEIREIQKAYEDLAELSNLKREVQ